MGDHEVQGQRFMQEADAMVHTPQVVKDNLI